MKFVALSFVAWSIAYGAGVIGTNMDWPLSLALIIPLGALFGAVFTVGTYWARPA